LQFFLHIYVFLIGKFSNYWIYSLFVLEPVLPDDPETQFHQSLVKKTVFLLSLILNSDSSFVFAPEKFNGIPFYDFSSSKIFPNGRNFLKRGNLCMFTLPLNVPYSPVDGGLISSQTFISHQICFFFTEALRSGKRR
jgi:hypothetical protein